MKMVLIVGGVALLAYFILSANNGAVAAPSVVAPSKWRGTPPASPNTTVAQPGTDQSGQGTPRALYLAPVKSLRYYQ